MKKQEAVAWVPMDVSGLEMAFPAKVSHMMPAYGDIPEAFKHTGNKWVRFQQDWFYKGLNSDGLVARDGIAKEKAIRHLATIQGSYEPKHEHKEAAVAYLASLWFTDNSTWTANTK